MNVTVVTALLGLVVSAVFAFNAIRELKRGTPGHSRNAAIIHIVMVAMLAPFCVAILLTN